MTIIKEFREFFFRNAKVTTGAKKDQETNYPTTYTVVVDGVSSVEGNRFLKNHFPSEDVFKKFCESVTFKLNTEDTSTASAQGLTQVATDAQVVLGTNTEDTYQLAPKPSQVFYFNFVATIPVAAGNYKVGDFHVINDITDASFGNIYVCTNAATPTFTLVYNNPIPIGGTTGQALAKLSNAAFDLTWISLSPTLTDSGWLELTNAECKTSFSAPKTFIASPGANKYIRISVIHIFNKFGTVALDAGTDSYNIYYTNSAGSQYGTASTAFLEVVANEVGIIHPPAFIKDVIDQPIIGITSTIDMTTGDGSIFFRFFYEIIDISAV